MDDLLGHLFIVGADILATTLDDKTKVVRVQLGNSVDGTVVSSGAEQWQPAGLVSRPAKATQGAPSCQALALRTNDRDIIFATRDTRGTGIYGNLKDGETCVYAAAGQCRTLYKANGTVVDLTTSDNTPGGQTHSAALGPDGYHLVTKFGAISVDASGITLTSGSAALVLGADGKVKLLGSQVAVQGNVVGIAGQLATCIGKLAAPTPGTPGPTSAVIGATGIAGVGSTSVFISP